jgi:hypothetical protein
MGADVFRMVDRRTGAPVESPLACVLSDGLPEHGLLVGRGGRQSVIEDSASPIRDRDGSVLGVVLVFHDVLGIEDRVSPKFVRRYASLKDDAVSAMGWTLPVGMFSALGLTCGVVFGAVGTGCPTGRGRAGGRAPRTAGRAARLAGRRHRFADQPGRHRRHAAR